MDRFTVEVLPVVVHFAALCFQCPDKRSLALTLAWFQWNRAKPEQQELPASVWARAGVRWVNALRDMPGVGTPAKDALYRAESGGAMEGLADTFPGPEQIVMQRERFHSLVDNATDRERLLIDGLLTGTAAKELAAKLGVGPSRITQLRQGMMDK